MKYFVLNQPENSHRDNFWVWGQNRDGQNMFGKMRMEIREDLRK